jgi:hypothetical protein
MDQLSGLQLVAEVERYRELAKRYAARAVGENTPEFRGSCQAVAESYDLLADSMEKLLRLMGPA